MQNRNSEELFRLVKGMTPWEKKNFHRYARRNVDSRDLKVLAVYQALNAMHDYDESRLVHSLKDVKKGQLSNLKVHLYNLLLDGLRLLKKNENIELQLHQLMDHTRILYDKGFAVPSLKTLKRVKSLALAYHQIAFLFQAVVMEKKLELVQGPCEGQKIAKLNLEMKDYSEQLSLIGQLSNTTNLLYSWYKSHGPIRNSEDEETIDRMFEPCYQLDPSLLSFYPKLYFLQATTYYYRIKKEDDKFYVAAKDWVELFQRYPQMRAVESVQYQQGLTHLSEAALLRKEQGSLEISVGGLSGASDKFFVLVAVLNLRIFCLESDQDVLADVMQYFKNCHNPERVLVLSQKAALLCHKISNNEAVIDFTHQGINLKTTVRPDLQLSLRLLHQTAHCKMGIWRVVEYLELSTKRFAKIHSLAVG